MAEYIDREAAINAVYESYADGKSAYGALISIPAADVRPVVRGRWIPTGETEEVYGDVYRCSACGCCDIDEVDFCPNCGAKMEGTE